MWTKCIIHSICFILNKQFIYRLAKDVVFNSELLETSIPEQITHIDPAAVSDVPDSRLSEEETPYPDYPEPFTYVVNGHQTQLSIC